MEGISDVIAVVMILMITVALASLGYIFFTGTFSSITNITQQSVNQTTTGLLQSFKVESASGNIVYIRNTGTGSIVNDSIRLYVDDIPMSISIPKQNIGPGEIAMINVSGLSQFQAGIHNLKITNPNNIIQESVEILKYVIGKYPDFSGWSDTRTYDCAGYVMMGGYNNFGMSASTQKTIDLPPGEYILEFNYYAGDSWDGESGRAFWNGNLIWSKSFYLGGSNLCGGSWGESNGVTNTVYSGTFNHPGGSATILFDSTLNQAANDEWFGVNNITITGLRKV